ncbi:unnamed protein product [Nezara viridula]|uniref:4'-phosphopantetheine phosphatase n=1 Tax=Nezara viridula TaxID=85310 RepID=A0A9P0MXM6_NEZVI|nr:unnamed protein product [Nezara viridula]
MRSAFCSPLSHSQRGLQPIQQHCLNRIFVSGRMVSMEALKNLNTAVHVTITVGQFSSSVSCVFPLKYNDVLDEGSPILEKEKTRIQIIYFPSSRLETVFSFIKQSVAKHVSIKIILNEIEHKRNIFLKNEDLNVITDHIQIKTAVEACNFCLLNVRDEAYILNIDSAIEYLSPTYNFYPHILVIFNNKIMFIKVNSTESYECIGESDIIDISKEGNSSLQLNCIKETIGSAKLFLSKYNDYDVFQEEFQNTSMNDEKSKLSADFKPFKIFCDNMGHLCTLHAKRHKINQVIFGESLSDDIIIKQLISKSVSIHSDNSVKIIFLRHERYLEGIGSLLYDTSIGISQTSWAENYCESSALQTEMFVFQEIDTFQLTLDSLDNLVTFCPVLSNTVEYFPDTQNLSENSSAREYWLSCISDAFNAGTTRTIGIAKKESTKNLEMYRDRVVKRLEYLRKNHDAYGYLAMRLLQDTLEHIKKEMGLLTMYEKRKQHENATAIKELVDRLNCLDSLDYVEQQTELVKYLLAGNMFDWGATEVAKLMIAGKLNFQQAIDKLPERPWLVDNLDNWTNRLKEYNYKKVMIFADNSGYDLILGVLPFARELVRRGAEVVICANCEPVLNDITFYELKDVFEEIKNHCPILRKAIEEGTLSMMKLAKSTCCLDLCFINIEVVEKMKDMDLLIIEGMGRAVHTNLYARFKCDSLRVAVIKDHWLSRELGGENFSCICKFSLGEFE